LAAAHQEEHLSYWPLVELLVEEGLIRVVAFDDVEVAGILEEAA